MIWTEEENNLREIDNMLTPQAKSCANCHWSNGDNKDEFITCGHHISNFTPNSMCCYWTNPKDKKLNEYYEKKKIELKSKMNSNGTK